MQSQNPEPEQNPPAQGHAPASPHDRLHVMVCPQLFVTVPLQRAPHASFGVQPHPFGPAEPPLQTFGDVHVSGQMTVCPQLLTFGPHATPLHVVESGSGEQPQELFVQGAEPGQVPQSIERPQLSWV